MSSLHTVFMCIPIVLIIVKSRQLESEKRTHSIFKREIGREGE